jgi:hypothetical protein
LTTTLDLATTRRWKQRLLLYTGCCLLGCYVVANLAMVLLATAVTRCTIEYHAIDAVTAVPVGGAEIEGLGIHRQLVTDGQGSVMEQLTVPVQLFWFWPRIFSFEIRHPRDVRAPGYAEQQVRLGEQFDGLWFRNPRGVVTIRLQR